MKKVIRNKSQYNLFAKLSTKTCFALNSLPNAVLPKENLHILFPNSNRREIVEAQL
jgi:hypothetical protein